MKTLKFLPLALMSLSSSVHATTVFIDAGRTTNQTASNYNNLSADALPDKTTRTITLIDNTGAATGWSLGFTETLGVAGDAGTGGDPTSVPASVSSVFLASAYGDNIFGNNGADGTVLLTFNFSGLSLANTYNLFMFGARPNQTTNQTWTLTQGTSSNAAPVTHASANNTTPVDWTGITPNSGGNITFTVASTGGGSAVNAIRLTAVPEPSAAALLGLGGLVALRRRRRSA